LEPLHSKRFRIPKKSANLFLIFFKSFFNHKAHLVHGFTKRNSKNPWTKRQNKNHIKQINAIEGDAMPKAPLECEA
jgi:hypothetical protein